MQHVHLLQCQQTQGLAQVQHHMTLKHCQQEVRNVQQERERFCVCVPCQLLSVYEVEDCEAEDVCDFDWSTALRNHA